MESYTTENVNQGARTNKFHVRCRTNLTDYLGEHQAQVFYAHLLIDQIVTPTGSEPPIRIRIGQSIPVDLTNRRIESGEISAPEPCLVLAMPVYFFKREWNSRSGHVSAVEERNDVSYTISADMPSSGDSSPKRVSNNREKSDRNLISLVTLIVYFPVSVMNSANSLCVVGDQQKHVHLAPHPHEFVAYPSTITLPIEELGGRIVRGFQHAQTLTASAMELPGTLLTHKLQRSDESQPSTELGRCSGTQLTHLVDTESHKLEKHFDTKHPTFVVISRDVYNRLQTLQRIQMDGVSLDQLQRPRNTVSRPWYSKVICTTPLSSTSPPVSNESDNRNPSGPISFLSWSGLRVATNLETTNGSSLSARQYSAGGYYVVFVRRQSFDCGAAIDSELISTQYPSAKFRRTRVRGTLHCGIKLKRRLTNTNGLDGIQNMMTINSRLVPPNLVKQMSGEDGLSWCIVSPIQRQEPTGWYTAFHSHSVDESRCSTTELHSSIAARVKRTPNSMGQDGTETGNSTDCTIRTSSSKLDEVVVDNLVDDVLMRPRNRVPPRRFDLTDPDLEIALKRSLIEQTPIRKRRSESDVCEPPNHISNRPDHVPAKQSKKLGNVEKSKQSAGTPYQSTFRNQRDQSNSRTSEHGYSMVEQNMLNTQMADSDEKSVLSTKGRIEDSRCEIISELSKSDKICLPPNRQGNDQLSCVVVNRSKFIPKLKLAKRSNGKFKILHLSRKRNCPLRSNCKLQKTPTRSVVDLITTRKTGSTVKNTGVHSVSVVSSNRSDCESLTGSNTLKALGPLNLSTHRRFLESDEW
ncbi:hypothetical protein FGIG_07985 [Fasciola gigantica]|uniref:Uncharacterized protein n=1 Tax=Fasciola gigantica TaxID=46835 RepID=A0A504XF19_FASGI|nr:hypothetical protein FGIG_07985 [Fasciola gigantica]